MISLYLNLINRELNLLLHKTWPRTQTGPATLDAHLEDEVNLACTSIVVSPGLAAKN